jgi:hypothetical protein
MPQNCQYKVHLPYCHSKILAHFFVCGACLFVEIPYNNLAEVLRRQEKYEMAGKIHRRALEGREKAPGLEHPFILASVNSLVGGQGKYEAAEDMDRRAWEGRKNVLGFEHPEPSRGVSRSGKVRGDGERYIDEHWKDMRRA